MILVTGATGTIGSALVADLLDRGHDVTAVTRNPERVSPRPGLTVTTRIVAADAIFLLHPAGPALPDQDLAVVRQAIDAGIPRVVKLSAIGTPENPAPTDLGVWHSPGERAVRESGQEWTILRPTTFASNTFAWVADIRAGRPVPNLFGSGRQGVIAPADVAAVAAEALTGAGHASHVYTLTGPELLSVPDQLAQLADILDTKIESFDVPSAETRAYFPPEIADVAFLGAELVRGGGNAIVTDDVPRILSRPATTFRDWAESHKAAFQP